MTRYKKRIKSQARGTHDLPFIVDRDMFANQENTRRTLKTNRKENPDDNAIEL